MAIKKQDDLQPEDFRKYRKPNTQYSDFDLGQFDQTIKKYITENGLDIKRFMFDNGAVDKNGSVIIEDLRKVKVAPDRYVYDCKPIRYEVLQDKLEQWMKWRARIDFGMKKRLETYEKTI